jgi:biotin synthase-like enzyme
MIVGGYLTTGGRPVEKDIQMLKDLGLSLAATTPKQQKE